MMKKVLGFVVAAVIVLMIAGGVLWGYRASRGEQAAEAQREAQVKAPSRLSSEDGKTVLSFDASAQRENGIVTASLGPISRRAAGQATGVVVQLQPLLDLRASYNTPSTDLIRARASARASAAEYERVKMLNADGKNASDKAVETARAVAESDAALVKNAQQAITIIEGATALRWGPVIARWIENSSPQLDTLLMQRAFLLQVTSTSSGQFAAPSQATVQYPDGSHATARLISVLPQLDPRLQIPSLLYQVAPHLGLVPGVNVTVFLPSGQLQSGVVVPPDAVVWLQGSAWCYVETSPGKFERKAVPTGEPDPHGWFVTDGITPGAHVATAGAQTLLSEEFRSENQVGRD